jgi:hypothetical protein
MKLEKNFKSSNERKYGYTDLDYGDMIDAGSKVIMKVYDGFLSLTDPSQTWCKSVIFSGRKLNAGESVTLIQE